MSRRAKRLTYKAAIILIACILLVIWTAPKLIMRHRAISQLQEDGFLYFDHRLVSPNPGISNVKISNHLTISQDTVAAIAFLQPRYVTIYGSSAITNLNFLAPLKSVETVDIEDCPLLEDVDALRNLVSLKILVLTDCASFHSLDVFSRLQSLRDLSLDGCSNLHDFRALQQIPSLTQLSLGNCESLTSVDELPALPKLHTLELAGCKHLRDICGVARFPALESLDLTNCVELQDVSALFSLRALETVHLRGCTNVPQAQIRGLISALPNAEIFAEKPATAPGAG